MLTVSAHNASVGLFADLILNNKDIYLVFKDTVELLKALYYPGFFQNTLLVAMLEEEVLGKIVGNVSGADLAADIGDEISVSGRNKLNIFVHQSAGVAQECLNLIAAGSRFKFGYLADVCYEIREGLHGTFDAGAIKTLYEYAHTATGQFEHLTHVTYSTYNVKLFGFGIFNVDVYLSKQEYTSVGAHSSFKSSYRLRALYIKIQNGIGEG